MNEAEAIEELQRIELIRQSDAAAYLARIMAESITQAKATYHTEPSPEADVIIHDYYKIRGMQRLVGAVDRREAECHAVINAAEARRKREEPRVF